MGPGLWDSIHQCWAEQLTGLGSILQRQSVRLDQRSRLTRLHTTPTTYPGDEIDDDDFGPKPLSAGMQHQQTDAVKEFIEERENGVNQLRYVGSFLILQKRLSMPCFPFWTGRFRTQEFATGRMDACSTFLIKSSRKWTHNGFFTHSSYFSIDIDIDPTKLKLRQFSRGSGPVNSNTDNSLWTETPRDNKDSLTKSRERNGESLMP